MGGLVGCGCVVVGQVCGSVVGAWVCVLLVDDVWVVGVGTPSNTHPATDQSDVGLAVAFALRSSARRCAEKASARR
jgi:hypothetical protein